MEFEFDNKVKHKIRVVGIGGAGNNAIDNMIAAGLEGVTFIAANTDLQDLEYCAAPIKLQLGAELTRGLGCGANPDIGRQAALEDVLKIKEIFSESDMVFITAGMGGGTGTGGAPVVAEALRELDNPPLTVAVVTKPFPFEGPRRMRQAMEGIQQLKEFANTIIVIPNERLLGMAPRGCSIKEAFRMADDVLLQAVKGVSDIIQLPGLINVDFMDAKSVMSNKGQALMGTGIASGPDRAALAAQAAISSPLLDEISIKGAKGVLINLSSSENNMSLDEVNDACRLIQTEVDQEAQVIFGVAWDNALTDSLRVTVIATGIEKEEKFSRVERDAGEHLASLEEVARRSREFERPTVERKRPAKSLAEFERPRYTKYESFIVSEEDLERPTFMRRKAD